MDNFYSKINNSFRPLIIIAIALPFIFLACNGKKSNKSAKQNAQNQSTTATGNQMQKSDATAAPSQSTHAAADTTKNNAITAAKGHKLSKTNGCFACHSIDGTKKVGPTWKDMYGRKTTLKDGSTVTADSAYIAKSITDPGAQVVKGYSPSMPSFNYLKKDQIASIIAYIKSISKESSS
jgi:cytochrome c oxidase subunit 2